MMLGEPEEEALPTGVGELAIGAVGFGVECHIALQVEAMGVEQIALFAYQHAYVDVVGKLGIDVLFFEEVNDAVYRLVAVADGGGGVFGEALRVGAHAIVVEGLGQVDDEAGIVEEFHAHDIVFTHVDALGKAQAVEGEEGSAYE